MNRRLPPENAMELSLCVLLIEDVESDAALIIRQLEKAGYAVVSERVETAAELTAALGKQTWDLVLADFSLPQFDAPAALAVLQATGLDVPFIVISGTIGEETAVDMMRAGAHDYLMKDHLARLGPAVRRELAEAQVRREHKQAEEALRESEFFFKESQRAAFVGSYKTNFITGVWESSEVLDQIFGIDKGYSRTIQGWLDMIHPDDAWMMDRYLRVDVISKRNRFNKEYRIVRKSDGEIRWVNGLGEVDSDAEGNVISLIGTIQDITERKRTEDELREAGAAKDRFLALLSHELRNPLTSIMNAAQLLKAVDADDPRLVRARDVIDRAATTQARILEDLLDVSRSTLGRVVLRKKPLRLDTLVCAVTRSLASQAAGNGLALEMNAEPDVVIDGDATRIEQVLHNLIGNAIKYTEHGSVWVTVHRSEEDAVVTVSDTGIGIAATMLPSVFDMFYQADESLAHTAGGLGLGLAIVKSFVGLHGGTVTAESDGPGQGARFTVRLPALAAGAAWETPVVRPVPVGGLVARRVLLVDDNVDARETLRDILELDGCTVFEAGDGLDALVVAERERPDVVLLDIGLPGVDGYEVARHLRAHPVTASTHIVAITGYGQEADKRKAAEAGCDDHLTKPVDLDALRAAVRG
jgi:signal transduction histidine kinase